MFSSPSAGGARFSPVPRAKADFPVDCRHAATQGFLEESGLMSQFAKCTVDMDATLHEVENAGSVAAAWIAPATPPLSQSSVKVAILLGTYNGQSYLAEQLDSFAVQAHGNWAVWASDDGSQDGTLGILNAYQAKWGAERLTLLEGPRGGFVANFLSLICSECIEADHYAYSDQDDIWDAQKLQRAVQWLETVPLDVPALYCGRTRLVDAANNEIGLSPLFTKPPSFANALMQNIGSGNTMVFNAAARALLKTVGPELPVVTHDWWTYIVVMGCGGRVNYDPEPTLRYRQHGGNLIGMNSTWGARLKRMRMLWQNQFHHWNECNIAALAMLQQQLTPESQETLQYFTQARAMPLIPRVVQFYRSGIYRQTLLGNIGLVAAVVFKKL